MTFKKISTSLEGCFLIEPHFFGDDRGFFMETYSESAFRDIGISEGFVQDNHSKSSKGVLRGLHFQHRKPQAKLVRVIKGAVYDVVVDLRRTSSTFGEWGGGFFSQIKINLNYLFLKVLLMDFLHLRKVLSFSINVIMNMTLDLKEVFYGTIQCFL